MGKYLEVRVLRAKQSNETDVFSFFLEGNDILKISTISRLRADNDGLLGYQRGEVARHVDEIVDYLDAKDGPGLFPNAIVLAMSTSCQFKQSRGPKVGDGKADAGVLRIPVATREEDKAAWIVDGQQRTLALAKAKNRGLMVPVTAFVSDDFEVHRSQFLLVNKVKPLPRGLINELLPAVNTMLPLSLAKNKIPSAICDILNKDPGSPFHELINRHSTDRKRNKSAVIADNSLIQVIKTSLNSVHGCLYQYKNVATGEIDVDSCRRVLNLFWNVVKLQFPDAWGLPPTRSRLTHGVGIKSMGVLMDRIMSNIHPDDPNAEERVTDAVAAIAPVCFWTSGKWESLGGIPKDQLQNTPSSVRLLSNMLIREYTGAARR